MKHLLLALSLAFGSSVATAQGADLKVAIDPTYEPFTFKTSDGKPAGFDIFEGEPMDAEAAGIWDNYRVKHQMLDSAAVIASQLLLVDEVIRAGKQMKKG